MTSKTIDPKGDTTGATHWNVYDDDPRVERSFGPFECQEDAEAFARQRNDGRNDMTFPAAGGGWVG